MRARFIIGLLAFWALAVPGLAQDRHGSPSLDRVLPEIRRSTPGTFYDAEGPFTGPNGQAAYRIKWMTPEGRIIWFYADARTGQVLGMGQGSFPLQNRDPDRYSPPGPPSGQFRDGGWPPGNGSWNGERGRGRDGDWKGRGGGDWNGRGGDHGGDRDNDRGHHGG